MPLSFVPLEHRKIIFTPIAWLPFELCMNIAHCLTVYAMPGLEFFDKYINIPTTVAWSQDSFNGPPSTSVYNSVRAAAVLALLHYFMFDSLRTLAIRQVWVRVNVFEPVFSILISNKSTTSHSFRNSNVWRCSFYVIPRLLINYSSAFASGLVKIVSSVCMTQRLL